MKKNFNNAAKNLFFGLIAASAVGMTSCNDDYDTFEKSNLPEKNSVSNYPLGCCVNSITSDIEHLCEVQVPVNTNRIVIKNSNPKLNYSVEQKNGKFFITPKFQGNNEVLEYDVLHLTGMDSNEEKKIFVSISTSAPVTRAIETGEQNVQEKVLSTLAKGFIPGVTVPDAQAKSPIFSASKMMEFHKEAEVDYDNFLDIASSSYSNYFYDKATSHNEYIKKEASAAGFNLTLPVGGWNIGLGLSTNTTENIKKIQDQESALYGWKTRTAVGSMSPVYLLNYLQNHNSTVTMDYVDQLAESIMAKDPNYYDKATLKSDLLMALAFQGIMDKGANEALNNSDMSNNDIENLRELIDQYGMYVSTNCQLGGMARTMMTKNSTSNETGIEWAMKVVAEGKSDKTIEETETSENKSKEGNTSRVVSEIIKRNPAAASFKLNVEKKSKIQDIFTAMNVKYETLCWGGNVNCQDIEKWSISATNPKEWVCISYVAPREGGDNFGEVDENNSSFIPLWKLCIDPVRRKALRQLIEPQKDGKIAYFNYKEQAKKSLVIADVQIKCEKSKNESDFRPYYAKDNRGVGGKTHLYVPLRHNPNGYEQNQSIVNLAHVDIVLGSSNKDKSNIKKSMVPYVAYEWVYDDEVNNKKDCTGITAIRFGEKGKNTYGENQCSDATTGCIFEGGTYIANDNKVLMITYASANTPLQNRITGVGFQYTNKDKRGKVFTSSVGTDWNTNYNTEGAFNNYWVNDTFINKDVAEDTNIIQPLVYLRHSGLGRHSVSSGWRTANTALKVWPCATTKAINTDAAEIARRMEAAASN